MPSPSRVKRSPDLSSRVLQAFVLEIVVVPIAMVLNHKTYHAGGWQDLSVAIVDLLILAIVALYSLGWAIVALVQITRRSRTKHSVRRGALGLVLHSVAIVAAVLTVFRM